MMAPHRVSSLAPLLLCLFHLLPANVKASSLAETREGGQILLATIFARGHTGPAMAVALELASRGHRITFAVPYKKAVSDHFLDDSILEHPKITFLPLPMSDFEAELLRSDLRLLSELKAGEAMDYGFKILLENSLQAVETLRHEFRYHKPDLFLCDAVFVGAILVGKENADVPFVRLSTTMVADSASKKFLPFLGLDFPVPMRPWQRYMSRAAAMAFESELLFKLGPLGQFRSKVKDLGLPPFRSFQSIHHGPVIIQSMMGLEPPRTTDPGYTFVGTITSPKRVEDLPEDLRRWLDERESVLYVTMATTNAASERFWETLVRAIETLPNITALLAVRGLNKDRLPSPLPTNVRQVDWVDQATALSHRSVRAMVNSAGMNSIHEGIAACLPQIMFPCHSDQFLNAFSLQRAGAGLKLDKDRVKVADIARAIVRVMEEESFRVQASRLALIQKASGGVRAAADTAELYLNLGAQGMALLKDAMKDLPWHARTGADILAMQVTVVVVFLWLLLRRFGYHTRVIFEKIPPPKETSVVESEKECDGQGRGADKKVEEKVRRRKGPREQVGW